MHPALSIIVFTTLSGLGYGLAAWLGLGLLDPAAAATKIAHVAALALIGAGLLSSTLHLGNPQRAWRALSQWRTSWLSREGVMAIVTFVPLTANTFCVLFLDQHVVALGLAGTLLSIVTVYCTAMIYGSLRSVEAWSQPLTPVVYLLYAGAGGALCAFAAAMAGGGSPGIPAAGALVFLVAAWAAKFAWRRHVRRLKPLSTPESATGLGFIGRVRLFEPPHMNDNYLTREMGFKVARKHAEKLFAIAVVMGGAVPVALILLALGVLSALGAGLTVFLLAALALLAHYFGVFIERWLFFAEARHAVMNYYGG